MKFVKTKRQLRKISKGVILQSWDREGPCPLFIKTPAVVIKFEDEEYLVFTTLAEVLKMKKKLEETK